MERANSFPLKSLPDKGRMFNQPTFTCLGATAHQTDCERCQSWPASCIPKIYPQVLDANTAPAARCLTRCPTSLDLEVFTWGLDGGMLIQMSNSSIPAALVPIQLPVNAPGDAAEDASSRWLPATPVGDVDRAPGS